jgi:hypothetical protein
MQLSVHDLKQLDEERILSLRTERLQTLSLKLLADLKEAHDRLNQDPENSSRPPSSRAPWERADADMQGDGYKDDGKRFEADGEGEEEAQTNDPQTQATDTKDLEQDGKVRAREGALKRGKPGKPKGTPGYGRTVELAVTAERTHRPHACALCAAPLPPDALQRAYTGRYEIDVAAPSSGAPGLELTHTLHTYAECRCGCGPLDACRAGSL